LLLVTIRKWAILLLHKSPGKTNMDLIIGTTHNLQKAIVDGENGEVKINGVVWTAIANNRENIENGELVKILEVKGNQLIVAKGE